MARPKDTKRAEIIKKIFALKQQLADVGILSYVPVFCCRFNHSTSLVRRVMSGNKGDEKVLRDFEFFVKEIKRNYARRG